MELTRRAFLKSGAAGLSLGALAPRFLLAGDADGALAAPDNNLVLLQLSGGNDGLNTVIPYADPLYAQHRPTIGVNTDDVLTLDERIGLHPSMAPVRTLFAEGKVAVVQGVGYPEPNRSHFIATEIWQTGSPAEPVGTGWLGRVNDECFEDDRTRGRVFPAVSLGRRLSLALRGGRAVVPAIYSLADFRLFRAERDAGRRETDLRVFDELHSAPDFSLPRADVLRVQMREAYVSSEGLTERVGAYRTDVAYPATGLASQLKLVVQMIAAGLDARAYHVTLGGFDTHANQAPRHAGLLRTLAEAVAAFQQDVAAIGAAARTVVMTYSEFGRRVTENGSRGTDHGSAAPMLVVGDSVRGGVYGEHPGLAPEQLVTGDLQWHTDFREIYAAMLEHWLDIPAAGVLAGAFAPLPVIATSRGG